MGSVSEKIVQNALFRHLQLKGGLLYIFPNIDTITGYEADLLAITRHGYAHEYEIKISLSDFRADLKKKHKHASLSGNTKTIPSPYYPAWGPETVYVMADTQKTGEYMLNDECFPENRPKYFWYVVAGFIPPINEVPVYAGLMTYNSENKIFECVKKAPVLPSKIVSPELINKATKSMTFRYWDMRLRNAGN